MRERLRVSLEAATGVNFRYSYTNGTSPIAHKNFRRCNGGSAHSYGATLSTGTKKCHVGSADLDLAAVVC
jgi:hypothetical protein